MHICALVSNTNLDDVKGTRSQITEELERNYDTLIARIWNGGNSPADEATEEIWQGDFMKAGRRALGTIAPPSLPGQEQIEALPEE